MVIVCPESVISTFQTKLSYGVVVVAILLGFICMFDEPRPTFIRAVDVNKYNGQDAALPIYLALKGIVFDVSSERRELTPPPASIRCHPSC